MPDPISLTKAVLRELEYDLQRLKPKSTDSWVTVQFNPETLKVALTNQIVPSNGTGDQQNGGSIQYVGQGTTTMDATLWFDISAPQPSDVTEVKDVREITKRVAYFMMAKKQPDKQGKGSDYLPPPVAFIWGAFQFNGIMTSFTESLEFFSSDGRPLRASVAFTLTQQTIPFTSNANQDHMPSGGTGVGTTPLVQAPAGVPLQQLVDRAGGGASWQAIAAANNIENPRILKAGISLNIKLF